MLQFLKNFFGKKNDPVAEVPYKVEAPTGNTVVVPPEPAKCGCGRSSTGLCVGLHKLTAEEWASHSANPAKAAAPAKKTPAKTAPTKQTPAKKTPAKPTPAKKTPAVIKAAPKTPTRRTKKPTQ
jgi:hypothetical protein